VDVIASVYRVGRLDTALNRFKVEVNAKENHMSGERAQMSLGCAVAVESNGSRGSSRKRL
jgi:hypothetical protein